METRLFTQVVGFDVIGAGEMITSPIKSGDWYLVPLDQWESTIPAQGVQAIDRILKSGIAIKGFIVADDKREVELKEKAKLTVPQVDSETLFKVLGVVFTVLGALAMGVVYLMLAVLAYDPLLICVTSENQWLLLAEW